MAVGQSHRFRRYRHVRGAAVWFAAHAETLGEIPGDMTSPATIRQWAYRRDRIAEASIPQNIDPRKFGDLVGRAVAEMTRAAHVYLQRAQRRTTKMKTPPMPALTPVGGAAAYFREKLLS